MKRQEYSSALCPICKAPLSSLVLSCPHCGTMFARCPICSSPVSTGPTVCQGCGTQLSLPPRKVQAFDPSASMMLPDATLLLRQRLEKELIQHNPALASLQKLSLKGEQRRTEGGDANLSRVGQQLGNYRLTRRLGSGGFAEVYLGEHIHLNAQAAIKVLLGELTPEDVHTFRSEGRTLVRLLHPHIIRVLDFGIEDTTPFLVMDYAPHGTLRHLHPRQSRLPLSTVISYAKQVADALHFAHTEQVIHRDIKPENILLGRRKELLLSDFGIALVAQGSLNRDIKNVAGTIAYMAPEQIQGHPHHASDQYALGVVVYEWLCGERPFRGKFMEIAQKQLLASPPTLCTQVPALPRAVEDVVFTALAKDPTSRFESVQAFAHALEQAGEEAGSNHV